MSDLVGNPEDDNTEQGFGYCLQGTLQYLYEKAFSTYEKAFKGNDTSSFPKVLRIMTVHTCSKRSNLKSQRIGAIENRRARIKNR